MSDQTSAAPSATQACGVPPAATPGTPGTPTAATSPTAPAASPMPTMDRRTNVGRRGSAADRHSDSDTGLERRRGPGRRRTDFMRTAEEGEMSSEQFLFVAAIDAFKRVNDRPFPTWTEVLEVIRKLGYRKTNPSQLNLSNAEDWTEPADAPAFKKPPQETPAV